MFNESSPCFYYADPTPHSTRVRVNTDELERYLNLVETEAMAFSVRFIHDSKVRLWYMNTTHEFSKHMLNEARAGNISIAKAAQTAQFARNEIMWAARRQLSEIGYAYSTAQKATGIALEQLQSKYSNSLFKKEF